MISKFEKGIWSVTFILIFLIGVLSFAAAKDQSISIDYNYSGGEEELVVDYSDFKLKVVTEENVICKYDVSSGISYGSMDEVFDLTGDKYHYVDFLGLGDGTYKYYIKCKNSLVSVEPSEFQLSVRINSLVKAQIILDKEVPLKEGNVLVKLITSKPVSNTPSLMYSVDGTSYKPLVIEGSGKTWQGAIVLDNSLKEGTLSFKFTANDLEGRQGTEISSGASFLYDLLKPVLITDIKAISDEGEIELSWYYEESDISEYNIYRSEFPNPDYTDFYKSVTDKDFTDTIVDKGKTYYYRVAAVDKAGNEADLSREVSGTNLISSSSVPNGLNAQLLGLVESFIIEINSVDSSLEVVESRVSKFSDIEKEMFIAFELDKKVTSARTEIDSIRSVAEKWKTQDLSRDDLVSKIDSSRIKLGALEKDIPSDISILDELSQTENLLDEKKSLALMELDGGLSQKEIEKSIKSTNKYIEENSVSVQSNFYDIEISYLDGKKEKYSVVKRKVSGEIEKMQDSYFVERVSSDVSFDVKDIKFRNRNYNIIKDDTVFNFETDTKEIFYYFPSVSSLRLLQNIEFSFVLLDLNSDAGVGITGFSILGSSGNGYWGVFGGLVLILILVYFGFFRGHYSDDYFRIINRINESKDAIDVKNHKKAREVYAGVKRMYSGLKPNEKKKIYNQLETLHNDILISEIEEDLIEIKNNKNKILIPRIELKIKSLPEEKRSKILDLFEKIKEEVGSQNAN